MSKVLFSNIVAFGPIYLNCGLPIAIVFYSSVLMLALCAVPFAGSPVQETPIFIEGVTMGTTYHITYYDEPRRNFKLQVDSLLAVVNAGINTYDTASEISRFNRSEHGIEFQLPYLREALKKAKNIHAASGGAFDPTVMPIVNAWGFGPGKAFVLSNDKVDSLKELVGFDKVRLSERHVHKDDSRVQLDLGGIGQGFGADVIFDFLRSQGISNMIVELGGEGLSLGKNLQKNKPWVIGILDPNSTVDNQFFKAYVTLDDQAFTTSGNYFNYRVVNGRKYGHTIDPVKGMPVQNSLLSASVFARDCSTADGWATAFMVMGVEKAIAKLKTLPDLDALLIYSDDEGKLKTFISPGIKKNVTVEPDQL
jgi:thiamine biosynthesis lipoprotein